MAKFIIKATITIDGENIKTKGDALDELQILLGCYEDMSDDDTEITIHID